MNFAIIGTRHPDITQMNLARNLAIVLSVAHNIRTGAADGIDGIAMDNTRQGHLALYLPWAAYNDIKIPRQLRPTIYVYDSRQYPEWTESVTTFHPAPQMLTRGAYALHARDYGIVTYPEKVDAVFAFPDRNRGGGTSQGMRIAQGLGIRLFVFACHAKLKEVYQFKLSLSQYLMERGFSVNTLKHMDLVGE